MSKRQKFDLTNPLHVQELIELVENGDLSEVEDVGVGSDEEEDEDDLPSSIPENDMSFRVGADMVTRREAEKRIHSAEENEEESQDNEDINEEDTVEINNTLEETTADDATQPRKKKNVKWSRAPFQATLQVFTANENNENSDATEPLYPIEYFSRYISTKDFENMATFTNIYALQNSINFRPTSTSEIQILFALHMIIGCLKKFPRIRMYWERVLGINAFLDNMTRDRFFQLRTCLHLVNNLEKPENCTDKLYKVRPIIDLVRRRCLELELEEQLCVDEQIIPFTGTLSIKQYIKGKPCPWGVKIFVLCGKSGLAYNFIPYQGKSTGLNEDSLKNYGQGAAVVLQLCQRIEQPFHRLYFDNYFSSYPLLQKLRDMNIYAAGTIRINRFSKPPVMSDSELKKKGRGWSDEVVSEDDIVLVKWHDNNSVCLASNFVGKGNEDEVRRWDKKEGKYIDIKRPEIVKMYNHSMGGVDLLDQMISLYRIFVRSRKWTLRVIMHFVDFAVVNSWFEYKKDCQKFNIPKNNSLDLLEFKMRVAESSISFGKTVPKAKRGRPSFSPPPPSPKFFRGSEKRPLQEIQKDHVDHMPQMDNNREATRCKLSGCKGRSHVFCDKCKVHLCFVKNRNCFANFHRE